MVTYVFLIYATVLIAIFKSAFNVDEACDNAGATAGDLDDNACKCIEDTQAMAASTGVRYPRLFRTRDQEACPSLSACPAFACAGGRPDRHHRPLHGGDRLDLRLVRHLQQQEGGPRHRDDQRRDHCHPRPRRGRGPGRHGRCVEDATAGQKRPPRDTA